jgi:hypothetical protein
MRRPLVLTLVLCLVVSLAVRCQKTEETAAPAAATSSTATSAPKPPRLCKTATSDCNPGVSQCVTGPITSAQATIPTEICLAPHGEAGDPTQFFVDVYSWNAFLALNWPAATKNCAADTTKSILDVTSGDGTYVVWQTYMPSEKVFVNPGTDKPAAWCNGNGLAAGPRRVFAIEAKATSEAKTLGGPFVAISEPGGNVLQAKGGVLTDQSKRWVRYERLMNRTEYDYIVPNLWSGPQLQALEVAGTDISLPEGTIEIKSAWKVLTPEEIGQATYFTTEAIVCNTPDGERTPCDDKPVKLGLVGLHIVQQVSPNGTLFWSTFEHVKNEEVFSDPTSTSPQNTNLAKAPYVELDANCKGINTPTQVKRVTPIQASAELNAYYQGLLGGSVFANYQLISTQWTGGASMGTPANVANIVLETYVQNPPETRPTGCMMCHFRSRTIIPEQDGGHSFFFLEARFATMKPIKK